jgi:UDP-GlcNAc:undecaprenyl-phosphate GlcNAc-1-phosphate transferase
MIYYIPYLVTSFILALFISLYAVPSVIKISRLLKLFDNPNERSATQTAIPTLGGIAIFMGFIFASTIGLSSDELPQMTYILLVLTMMFFVGLKDDIVTLSWWKKLIAQIIVTLILIFFAKIRITHLHEIFGIAEIGIVPGSLLTIFVIVVIINAFNLMDGIDGLAAGLSMLAISIFGIWFLVSGHYQYAIISVSLFGSTAGFFYFNVYGTKNKIFMGDTGSLILGTIMSVIVIQFNELNIDPTLPYYIQYAPAVSIAILIYPLADTLKVFTIRVVQFKSPFAADKNHLHHRLLTLGFSHRKATYTIITFNLAYICTVFMLQPYGLFVVVVYMIFMGSILFMLPAYFVQIRMLIGNEDPFQQLLMPGSICQLLENRRKNLTRAKEKVKTKASNVQTYFRDF